MPSQNPLDAPAPETHASQRQSSAPDGGPAHRFVKTAATNKPNQRGGSTRAGTRRHPKSSRTRSSLGAG
eukprot:10246740-Lingulodinium_polyedra.AAC.1